MCDLCSVTKGQSAVRDLFAVKHDRAGNLPPLPGVFPDQMAPIIRSGADGERELVMGRCHVAKQRARSVGASGILRPLRLQSAAWSSRQREAHGGFGLRRGGVGR